MDALPIYAQKGSSRKVRERGRGQGERRRELFNSELGFKRGYRLRLHQAMVWLGVNVGNVRLYSTSETAGGRGGIFTII